MRVRLLGTETNKDNATHSVYATDRTDRRTYILRGREVTDPQALEDVGRVPDHETIIEIPEHVLKMYLRRREEEAAAAEAAGESGDAADTPTAG